MIVGDDRPFVLSTPRLEASDSLHLRIPFQDERVDWLFRAKSRPQHWSDIAQRFDLTEGVRAHLRSMFTDIPPQKYVPYCGSGIRWRYFGHACILIESQDINILFDPVLSYTYESGISRYTYEDLPDRIDYVVITHNHQDHILFETLLQIRDKTETIVVPGNRRGALYDPSLKLIFQNTGFKNVVELQELESICFDGGAITGLPFLGEHADLDVHSKLGYLVKFGKLSMLMLADSCNLDPVMYENLHDFTGDVTALFIGMECDGAPLSWLYGPLLTRPLERNMDASRRLAGCDYAEAIDIVHRFNPKEVYVYAMGQEPWLNYIMSIKYTEQSRPIVESNLLIQECIARGIRAERLYGEKEILRENR
jgi:L-ascorbate metabolism protein UlaG (beta-lactamase superfamily)